MRHIAEKHAQLLEDYNFVRGIGFAADETGGWLPDKEIVFLLESPTKKMACRVLLGYLQYWFDRGIEDDHYSGNGTIKPSVLIKDNPGLQDIADRWSFEIK